MGIPEILQNMLASTADSYSIKSWSIYPEKDGTVTFKIRFCGESEPAERDISNSNPAHYKRKSTNEIRRDQQRSELRYKHIVQSKSPDATDMTRTTRRMVTRSSVADIEIPRTGDHAIHSSCQENTLLDQILSPEPMDIITPSS